MHRFTVKLSKWIESLIRIFEIILSLFLIVGVVSACVMMVLSLRGVFLRGTVSSLQQFLDDALLYIIGLEVALMLIKRDPHLVTDILIFAIARKMIVTMQSGIDFFLGSLAILLLYVVKCYGISCILLPRRLWANLSQREENIETPPSSSSESSTTKSTNS